MKVTTRILTILLALSFLSVQSALGEEKKKTDSFIFTTRLEMQKKTRDLNGNYNPESFSTNMLLYSKKLSKKRVLSAFISSRMCLSDGKIASTDIGLTRTTVLTPKLSANIGYSFSKTAERSLRTPEDGADRFSAGFRYSFNKGNNKSPETAFSMSMSSNTDLNNGRSITAGLSATYHLIPKKLNMSLGAKSSYSYSNSEIQSFMYDCSFSYNKKTMKYALGAVLISNTFKNNVGNNAIYSFSLFKKQ